MFIPVWQFQGDDKDLASLIRPLFRSLVPIALQHSIVVAVVTFSPQTHLIAEALKIQFPTVYQEIALRCSDGSWSHAGNGSQEGKQPFMASAAHELSERYNIEITRRSTLLIDDDFRNVHIALKYKTPAIRFVPENVDL